MWDDSNDLGFTWSPVFDKEDMEVRSHANNSFLLPACQMRFIDDHFGLRPGCVHTLLGSYGRGKSTLVHSLILEWGKKEKILLYLTEETTDRVEMKLFLKDNEADYLIPKLRMTHESEFLKQVSSDDYRGFLHILEEKIKASESRILVIDNITTSQFYDSKFKSVMPIIQGLRSLAQRYQIAILFVCHTKKGVSETTKGLLQADDVRGSAIPTLTADYFYTFYRIRKTNEFGATQEGAFVYVNKSRDHDNQDNVYRLDYNVNAKRYVKDNQVNFKVFRDFLKERDRG